MHKAIALLLSFTILTVSSLPAVAEAATCSTPAHLIAQQQADGFASTIATHHHQTMFNGDWQTCRIECGCGCHRNVDALPHLLAPFSLNSSALAITIVTMHAPRLPAARLHARWHPLATPPPITL